MKGYDLKIKIYKYNDEEVLEFIKDCSAQYNSKSSNANKADAFRMYILSKYKNHLWLDMDVYIHNANNFVNTFNFNEKYYYKSWWLLYNCNNLEFFKNIYEYYKKGMLIKLTDYKCTEFLGYPISKKRSSGLIHLFYIDNYENSIWYLVEETDEFIESVKNLRKKYIFISYNSLHIDQIHSLKNDKELINFINITYPNKLIKYDKNIIRKEK